MWDLSSAPKLFRVLRKCSESVPKLWDQQYRKLFSYFRNTFGAPQQAYWLISRWYMHPKFMQRVFLPRIVRLASVKIVVVSEHFRNSFGTLSVHIERGSWVQRLQNQNKEWYLTLNKISVPNSQPLELSNFEVATFGTCEVFHSFGALSEHIKIVSEHFRST